MTSPYVTTAMRYREAGWTGVLPLPENSKTPPPPGHTGWGGNDPTEHQVEDWVRGKPYRADNHWINPGNIALRLPDTVVGLDFDLYRPQARDAYDRLVGQLGALPATWVSTSRRDGSGIRLYRIEPQRLTGKLGDAGEVVQYGHRYVVASPSMHPEGRVYRWVSPHGEIVDEIPSPTELPELPISWLQHLQNSQDDSQPGTGRERPSTEWSVEVKAAALDAVSLLDGNGRHDSTVAATMALCRLEALEHPGATDALKTLRRAYTAAVGDTRGGAAVAADEYDRMVTGARMKLRSDPPAGPTFDELAEQKNIGSLVAHPPAPDQDDNVIWPTGPAYPTQPHEAVYAGLAGDIVEAYDGLHEGDPVAVLTQFLTGFGNAVGRRPYISVAATRHYPNLFVGIVGPTSLGRKGTSHDVAVTPLIHADPAWSSDCRSRGLSTAEGLIHHVRDPKTNQKNETVDEGVTDKRMFIVETEAASILKRAAAPGNTLTVVLRQAWDSGDLRTLTKQTPEKATGAHISLVAHCTADDLRLHLADVDILNGLANRFLWIASKSTIEIPLPDALPGDTTMKLANRVLHALDNARRTRETGLSSEAEELWRANYSALRRRSEDAYGAATARGPAQVLRLALVYSLLDHSTTLIERRHLESALALWVYAEQSALWIFGDSTGNRQADKLLGVLRETYPEALSANGAHRHLHGNYDARPLLQMLEERGLVMRTRERNGARGPFTTVYRAVPPNKTKRT